MSMPGGGLSEWIAQQLVCRRLSVPALALLYAHKPLSFMGAQLLLVLQPFLNILFPRWWIDEGIALLMDHEQLNALLHRLESPQVASSITSQSCERRR